MSAGPLDGIRILDLTRVVMGPFATQILADQGADVVVIESADGDTNRLMGTGPHPELSGVSLNLMRNKRSVVLDLKSPDGIAACRKLAADVDVVVATMRPGALERLRLTYDDLKGANPGLIYCQGQGYPLDGPDRDLPAYDDVIQAATGVADITGQVYGERTLLPTIFADKVSGLYMAQAISAALVERSRTGVGQHIEIAMTTAISSFLLAEHGSGGISEPPTAEVGYRRILSKERKPCPTADGWIHILPYIPKHYANLFKIDPDHPVDPELYGNRRNAISNSDELYRLVRQLMTTRTTAEWLDYCRAEGIPATAVTSIQDLVDALPLENHSVIGQYRVIPPAVKFGGSRFAVRREAPLIGADTEDIIGQ